MRCKSNSVVYFPGTNEKRNIKDVLGKKVAGKKKKQATMSLIWQGKLRYFTVLKHIQKDGEEKLTYQISNYHASAHEHTSTYAVRWQIEIFFRTAKQSLGLSDCQSTSLLRQINHILHVFQAYCLLQIEKRSTKLKNCESVIKRLKRKNFRKVKQPILLADHLFTHIQA